MSIISVSSPFLRKFTHSETTVGTATVEILAAALPQEKRVALIIQNKSSANSIQVILNPTGTAGLLIPALGSLNLDNYNGTIRVSASAPGTVVHLAYSAV
jgi:hypothetical protein